MEAKSAGKREDLFLVVEQDDDGGGNQYALLVHISIAETSSGLANRDREAAEDMVVLLLLPVSLSLVASSGLEVTVSGIVQKVLGVLYHRWQIFEIGWMRERSWKRLMADGR